MSTIKFSKYQGLGNDFILIYDERLSFSVTSEQAIRWCDRRLGVGADGVIIISSCAQENAQAKMHIFNADGSRPEMCGNGFRCVARWLKDNGNIVATKPLAIETDAGIKAFKYMSDGMISVDMGEASGQEIHLLLEASKVALVATQVDLGNPHVVLDVPVDTKRAAELGSAIESHAMFPAKTNVEFITHLEKEKVHVLVWERGVGLTQACGTGACAVVASLVARQRLPLDTSVMVVLPGGPLFVSASGLLQEQYQWRMDVTMRGPAVKVFEGVLDG